VKKTKLQKNNSILEEKIKEKTGWNRARIFVIVGLVVSIIKLERVNLKKIAKVLNPENSIEVNYRRLSRFFQKFRFDKNTMAKLMSSFLPKGKLILSMDRTNWKFGKVHINILMLSVAYKGMAIPVVWYLLKKTTKQGNSGFRDRIRVVKKFIAIFGVGKIFKTSLYEVYPEQKTNQKDVRVHRGLQTSLEWREGELRGRVLQTQERLPPDKAKQKDSILHRGEREEVKKSYGNARGRMDSLGGKPRNLCEKP